MKRGGTKWTVDWAGTYRTNAGAIPEPKVGHVVQRFTPTNQNAGFYRVTAVRQVKTVKPMQPPYTARYHVDVEFIREEYMPTHWILYAEDRKHRPKPIKDPSKDRFSPLL